MYARLNLFQVERGMRAKIEELADQFAPRFRAQKGFKSVTFLFDDGVGEYGSLSLWDSKEDAEMASAVLGAELRQAAENMIKESPRLRVFEVYQART
jgi:heme-degrading monooxygenase HmoA